LAAIAAALASGPFGSVGIR